MRHVALTIRADAVEEVLDNLLPLLPQGVHEALRVGETVELDVYGVGPGLLELEAAAGDALVGAAEGEAPDDPTERRMRALAARPAVSGVVVRPSGAPVPEGDVLDVIIDAPGGAFGAGAHPTTAMCLELLMALRPGGPFADLGCGTGVLAITAALRGWWPVLAVDHELFGVEAARANVRHNGVEVDVVHADLLELEPPPAPTIAANVPPALHDHLAAELPRAVRRVIVSGITEDALDEVTARYAGLRTVSTLTDGGWAAALLVRDG